MHSDLGYSKCLLRCESKERAQEGKLAMDLLAKNHLLNSLLEITL